MRLTWHRPISVFQLSLYLRDMASQNKGAHVREVSPILKYNSEFKKIGSSEFHLRIHVISPYKYISCFPVWVCRSKLYNSVQYSLFQELYELLLSFRCDQAQVAQVNKKCFESCLSFSTDSCQFCISETENDNSFSRWVQIFALIEFIDYCYE